MAARRDAEKFSGLVDIALDNYDGADIDPEERLTIRIWIGDDQLALVNFVGSMVYSMQELMAKLLPTGKVEAPSASDDVGKKTGYKTRSHISLQLEETNACYISVGPTDEAVYLNGQASPICFVESYGGDEAQLDKSDEARLKRPPDIICYLRIGAECKEKMKMEFERIKAAVQAPESTLRMYNALHVIRSTANADADLDFCSNPIGLMLTLLSKSGLAHVLPNSASTIKALEGQVSELLDGLKNNPVVKFCSFFPGTNQVVGLTNLIQAMADSGVISSLATGQDLFETNFFNINQFVGIVEGLQKLQRQQYQVAHTSSASDSGSDVGNQEGAATILINTAAHLRGNSDADEEAAGFGVVPYS